MLTFTSCALFAQSKKDTIPKNNPPRTDTISTKKDTISALRNININPNNGIILKENSKRINPLKNETVYAIIPAKENEKN